MSLRDNYELSGELRRVVEEVAERAANSAAEKTHLRIQLDLMEMEKRLTRDLSDIVEEKIEKALGMTPQKHIIQHAQFQRTNDFFGGLQTDLWKKILLILIFGGMAFFGGYATDLKISKAPKADQAITRDEYHYDKGLSNVHNS